MDDQNPIILTCTRSLEAYRDRVAYHLRTFPEYYRCCGAEDLERQGENELSVVTFADGEMEVEAPFSMRNRDVFLLAGSGRNPAGISPSECKMEMYHAVDCIRRGSPKRLTFFEPFFSPARSDRTTRRNSVGFWIHTKLLSSIGVDSIVTYQLHSDKSKTAVDPTVCQMEDIPAISTMMEFIAREILGSKVRWEQAKERWLFCSVDAGGETMARKYAQAFDIPLIIAHKQRDYRNVNTVRQINILSDSEIRDKDIWIVDDMVDTAGSLIRLAAELKRRNVRSINMAAIHPVLSPPAVDRLDELHQKGELNELLFLDTIPITEHIRNRLPFMKIVDSSRVTAELIMHMHANTSLSPFFVDFSAVEYFGRK